MTLLASSKIQPVKVNKLKNQFDRREETEQMTVTFAQQVFY